MDKVEYEEWALKGIDVAIAPQPWSSIQSAQSDPKQQTPKKDKVTILYPKSILEPKSVLETLKAQLAHREPHHRAMMRRCILYVHPFAAIPSVSSFSPSLTFHSSPHAASPPSPGLSPSSPFCPTSPSSTSSSVPTRTTRPGRRAATSSTSSSPPASSRSRTALSSTRSSPTSLRTRRASCSPTTAPRRWSASWGWATTRRAS